MDSVPTSTSPLGRAKVSTTVDCTAAAGADAATSTPRPPLQEWSARAVGRETWAGGRGRPAGELFGAALGADAEQATKVTATTISPPIRRPAPT